MRGRKEIIISWVMFVSAAFLTTGCIKETGEEETSLVRVEQADIPEEEERAAKEDADDGGEESKTGIIYVDVCGQVKNPGVYQLTDESRVYEAIEKAGGMTKKAAAESVNQAERLTDGQQIYIPSEEERYEADREGATLPAGKAAVNTKEDGTGGKVNLNTASKEEIMTLSGIGEVKADSIIRYRKEHGGFQSVEDIKRIEGIKDGVFSKIKDQITI